MLEGAALVEYLRGQPWESMAYEAPKAALDAAGMITYYERKLLPWLTEHMYRGWGEILELGTFIGSSSVGLGAGLERNRSVPDEAKTGRIHAFDRFKGGFEANWIKTKTSLPLDDDGGFLGTYRKHTEAFSRLIEVHQGDLHAVKWSGKPIEILFVDVLKQKNLTEKVVKEFFRHLVPGKSIVVQQDYLFNVLPYSVVLMEHFADYFERAGDTIRNSVVFVYTKQIPDHMLAEFGWDAMPEQLRLHYLMQALGKQTSHLHREFIAHQISDFVTGKYR